MTLDGFQQARLDAYEALRAANPHLPPPNKVTADDGNITITLGGLNELPRVTLTVYVDIPEGWRRG